MKKLLLSVLFLGLPAVDTAHAQGEQFAAWKEAIDTYPLSSTTKETILKLVREAEDLSKLPFVPFDSIDKLLDTTRCVLWYALLFETRTTPEESHQRVEPLNALQQSIIQSLFDVFVNPFPPLPNEKVDPPAAPCSVRILLERGGRPVDPLGKFRLGPGEMLTLEAVGAPPGGTFQWSLDPADPNLAGLLTSTRNGAVRPRSTFFAKRSGTYRVTVKYTTPNGQMCESTLELIVR